MNISKQFNKKTKIDKRIWEYFGTSPKDLAENILDAPQLSDWTNAHWDYNLEMKKFCFGDMEKKKPQGYFPYEELIQVGNYTMIVFFHEMMGAVVAAIFDNDNLVEWPGKFK